LKGDSVMDKRTLGMCVLMLASGVMSPIAATAAWPEKPVRIIIPWPPGGSTDIVGRLLAAELTNRFKQQVFIDNRAGATGIVGMTVATQSKPDGYTFMMTSTAYGHLIYKTKVNVDLDKSFDPVALLGFGDSAMVVHPSLPVKNVRELIALAKARPGQLFYPSSGVGGFPHMNTELFKLKTGTDIVHVPFNGGGPALIDLVAGNTQVMISTLVTVYPQVSGKRLRLIGIGSAKRNPAFPDVPTISEAVPGYETSIWWGLFAPPGTPADAIARMHTEATAVMSSADMQKRLEEQGGVFVRMSSAEFGKLMKAETEKWMTVVKAANIKED
jgi:tripartite-type tricarboxylate transporter receptor subunit TctC